MSRPIRKKGFFRAWKRRELMAIVPYDKYEIILTSRQYAYVYADAYCPAGNLYVMWPDAFGNQE